MALLRRAAAVVGVLGLTAAAVGWVASTGAGAARRAAPVVTAAVQVTPNPSPVRAHSSPQIAVNPTNDELVVVESDVRGSRTCDVRISTDQGRTWFPGGDPMRAPFEDCSFYAEYGPYASLAFARDGTLYVAFVASEVLNRARNETPRHVFLARSSDGGRSFVTSRVFEAPDGNPDRGLNKGPTLAVDPSDPQRVYVGWRQGIFAPTAREKLKSNVAASRDGGRTFSPPVDLTDERGGDYPALAVDGKGTLHAVYWTRTFPPVPFDQPNPVKPIYTRHSTDGGRTWSARLELDAGNQRAHRPPAIAADPRSSAVYVTWHSSAEPRNQAPGFSGDLDVFFRASQDGGRTWLPKRVVNDDGAQGVTANQFDPGIAVAPGGRVDVAWYDGRLSPLAPDLSSDPDERGLQDVFYASSSDGGRTFTPNRRVTDRSIDRSIGVWSNNIDSHTNVGITSGERVVHVAWQDSRAGRSETGAEDVYSAAIALDGRTLAGAAPGQSLAPWATLGAGLALGMGLAMALAWARLRTAGPPAIAGDAKR